MKTRLLTVACLAAFSVGDLSAGETGYRVGQFFPDFRLPDLKEGKLTSLSAFRGKKTLLLVFSSW